MILFNKVSYISILLLLFHSFSPIAFSNDQVPMEEHKKKLYIFYSGVHSPMFDIVEGRLLEAFNRIGLKAKLVQTVSSQRALVLANTEGDGDGIRIHNIKEIAPQQTNNLMQVSEPILTNSMSVYTNKKKIKINGWGTLKGYNNGFRKGVKLLEKNVPAQRNMLTTADRLFQMLAAERLDTVLEWDLIASKMLKDLNLTSIRKLSPSIATAVSHIYIQKKYRSLAPQLSNALFQMKKDGVFLKIKDEILKQ